MRRVAAGQLAFTRVEAELSPRARAGYQVVAASPSLPRTVVAEIEERVRCFGPAGERHRRLQFSPLLAGGYLVSRTSMVPVDREVTDRAGRTTFLAHAVWLDDEAMERLACDPFRVLETIAERRDAVAWIAELGAAGEVGEIEIEPPADREPAVVLDHLARDAEERRLVVRLVADLLERSNDEPGSALFLAGAAEVTERRLRAVVAGLPRRLRPLCSFDTHVDGCPAARTPYRFVGGERRPAWAAASWTDAAVVPDAAGVAATTDGAPAAATVYLRWLERKLAAGEPLARWATTTADQVATALAGNPAGPAGAGGESAGLPIGELDAAVCRELLTDEEPRVGELLAGRLRRVARSRFDAGSAERIARKWPLAPPLTVLRALCEGGLGPLLDLAAATGGSGRRTASPGGAGRSAFFPLRRRILRWIRRRNLLTRSLPTRRRTS